MVRSCIYCKENQKSNNYDISFHRFPVKKNIMDMWISSIPINLNLRKCSFLCSKHFKDEDYVCNFGQRGRTLKVEAVPSIFEDHTTLDNKELTNISEPSTSFSNIIQESDTEKCSNTPEEQNTLYTADYRSDSATLTAESHSSTEEVEACTPIHRKRRPLRYVGDITTCNFSSRKDAETTLRFIQLTDKKKAAKIKYLNARNRRLTSRISTLESLVSNLADNKLITKHPAPLNDFEFCDPSLSSPLEDLRESTDNFCDHSLSISSPIRLLPESTEVIQETPASSGSPDFSPTTVFKEKKQNCLENIGEQLLNEVRRSNNIAEHEAKENRKLMQEQLEVLKCIGGTFNALLEVIKKSKIIND